MKSILVSGGSRGIGRAIIERFAAEGFNIAVCARHKEQLDTLSEQLKKTFPGIQVYTEATDVTIKEQVNAFAQNALRQLGQIDVLVNNAGAFEPGQILNETEGVLERLFQVNVNSAYQLSRAVVPNMVQKGSGHVFNMCSTASITPYVNGGSYCITKFALLGMSKVLREELKEQGIRVTAVLLGATRTDSWAGTELPFTRFIKASDVAEAVWSTYCLSELTVVEEILIRPQLGDI